MRRRICLMICLSAIVGVSLGMQLGMYMWHVPPAFPKPAEKVKDTFVEGHHARPLLKTRVENYAKPSPCAEKCLAHIRAYYNHYYGKEIVYERAEGCNVVFREGVDVSRMNVSAYEKFEHVLMNISNGVAICMQKKESFSTLPILSHVDVFIGTQGTGHITPGAKVPFGMIYLVPVQPHSSQDWWKYTAGYQYDSKFFTGIAHSAMSGAGMPGLLDIVISPFNAKAEMDKKSEQAYPGYYSVRVQGVDISVVAGNRFGIHRYRGTRNLFFVGSRCSVQQQNVSLTGTCRAYFNQKWEGTSYPYKIFFYATVPRGCTLNKNTVRCIQNDIELKIAVSYVDIQGAKNNYEDENTDYDTLRRRASVLWAHDIGKIQVHGWRSTKQRRIFTSAMYRSLLSPYTHNDADGRVRGPDNKIHRVDFTYYTFLSTWDVFRAWTALIRLVRPDVLTDIAKTSVFHYKWAGMMPRWTISGFEYQMMPGVHSITMAFQAWKWGLTDDLLTREIYDAMVGTLESRGKYKGRQLEKFVETGVVPCGAGYREVVSETLELGINAFCVAELAAYFKDPKEKRWRYLADAYKRLFDPKTKYLVGVSGSQFCRPASVLRVNADTNLYTEGNAITWLWSVPHDWEGLYNLLGPELFKQRLDDLFEKDVGRVTKPDYSGLIGAYAHGNEPTHHVPFWFGLIGNMSVTNKLVHHILETLYDDTPSGLPGNDDAGQMSAWYVLATLGVYPVDPTAKDMRTHRPLVKHATLNEYTGERHTLTPSATHVHAMARYTIPDSLKPYVYVHPEGGLFVKTGDIPEMWIRDSVAQVWPYRASHPGFITEVLFRQSEFILHDVYANSYNMKWKTISTLSHHMQTLGRGEWVGTRNYELDSGCYFIRLLYDAWKHQKLNVESFRPTVELLIETWSVEQYHEEQSPYRYPELAREGLGTPVAYTGMTWTGFRPSDDACKYGYLIPANMFAATVLKYVAHMYPDFSRAEELRKQIISGIETHGTWADANGVTRYCYEVDGLGGCNKMDDANIPSLLSVPYIDPEETSYNRSIWENTYAWIWSTNNPHFYRGKAAEGIGSPHTPRHYIWPMSLVIRGMVDPTAREEMISTVQSTMVRGKLHESFHKDNAHRLTREDFSWPNELFKELLAIHI